MYYHKEVHVNQDLNLYLQNPFIHVMSKWWLNHPYKCMDMELPVVKKNLSSKKRSHTAYTSDSP